MLVCVTYHKNSRSLLLLEDSLDLLQQFLPQLVSCRRHSFCNQRIPLNANDPASSYRALAASSFHCDPKQQADPGLFINLVNDSHLHVPADNAEHLRAVLHV